MTWRLLAFEEKRQAIAHAIAGGAGSASEIADDVGAPSRNAVIGFCARAGLTLPGKPNGPGRPRQRRERQLRDEAAPPPPEHANGKVSAPRPAVIDTPSARQAVGTAIAPEGGVAFLERTARQCCWPLWPDRTSPDEKRVCGGPVLAGSYCREHAERARGVARPAAQPTSEPLKPRSAFGDFGWRG